MPSTLSVLRQSQNDVRQLGVAWCLRNAEPVPDAARCVQVLQENRQLSKVAASQSQAQYTQIAFDPPDGPIASITPPAVAAQGRVSNRYHVVLTTNVSPYSAWQALVRCYAFPDARCASVSRDAAALAASHFTCMLLPACVSLLPMRCRCQRTRTQQPSCHNALQSMSSQDVLALPAEQQSRDNSTGS